MSCPISAILNPLPEGDPEPKVSQDVMKGSEASLPTPSDTPQQPQFGANGDGAFTAAASSKIEEAIKIPAIPPQIVVTDSTTQRNKRAASTSAPSSPQDNNDNLAIRRKRAKLDPISVPTIVISGVSQVSQAPALKQPSEPLTAPYTGRPLLPNARLHSTKRRFNIFNAFLAHPSDLLLTLCTHFRVPELLSLYAISKPFHYIMNLHLSTYMLACARHHAPEGVEVFPFRCYAALCILDPIKRPHPLPSPQRKFQDRLVPGFKWLQMVVSRERAVEEILALLALKGHRLPRQASITIKKIWMVMDVGTNNGRVNLVHNDKFFTNRDLICATMFFFKLDMRFSDPVAGRGETAMRKMLLGMKGLGERGLLGVLRGTFLRSKFEVLQWYVRQNWRYRSPAHTGMTIFGIPRHEVGTACLERIRPVATGSESQGSEGHTVSQAGINAANPQINRKKLLRPDELVMREGVVRKLRLQKYYLDAILFGYIDPRTLEDIPVPTVEETMAKLKLWDEEYGA